MKFAKIIVGTTLTASLLVCSPAKANTFIKVCNQTNENMAFALVKYGESGFGPYGAGSSRYSEVIGWYTVEAGICKKLGWQRTHWASQTGYSIYGESGNRIFPAQISYPTNTNIHQHRELYCVSTHLAFSYMRSYSGDPTKGGICSAGFKPVQFINAKELGDGRSIYINNGNSSVVKRPQLPVVRTTNNPSSELTISNVRDTMIKMFVNFGYNRENVTPASSCYANALFEKYTHEQLSNLLKNTLYFQKETQPLLEECVQSYPLGNRNSN